MSGEALVGDTTYHEKVYNFLVDEYLEGKIDQNILEMFANQMTNVPLVTIDGILNAETDGNLFIARYISRVIGSLRGKSPQERRYEEVTNWDLMNEDAVVVCESVLDNYDLDTLLGKLRLFEGSINVNLTSGSLESDLVIIGFAKEELDLYVENKRDSIENARYIILTALPNYVLATRLNEFLAQQQHE